MELRRRGLPDGWYPGRAEACRRDIEDFGGYIRSRGVEAAGARGGLAPHAGWYFSGRLAALVFDLVARNPHPDVVAVFGGHLGGGPGLIYDDQAWETPLGPVEIDRDLTGALIGRADLRVEGPYTNDNTVEIQMPLVKYYFPESRLLALRAPHSAEAIKIGRAAVEAAQEQGKTLAAFGSTDLTHYGPNYGFSPQGRGDRALKWVKEENDRGFIDLALAMDAAGMLDHAARHHSACSAGGAAAALAACQAMGAEKGLLADYYTSADIMPGESFVGYAGIVF